MAYAKKFEPHLDLLNMNIKEYIQYVIHYTCTCTCKLITRYMYMYMLHTV